MDQLTKSLFEVLQSEAGLVSTLLFFSNMLWVAMFTVERKDRKEAWRSNAEFKQQVIDAMQQIIPLLAVINDRFDRKRPNHESKKHN